MKVDRDPVVWSEVEPLLPDAKQQPILSVWGWVTALRYARVAIRHG